MAVNTGTLALIIVVAFIFIFCVIVFGFSSIIVSDLRGFIQFLESINIFGVIAARLGALEQELIADIENFFESTVEQWWNIISNDIEAWWHIFEQSITNWFNIFENDLNNWANDVKNWWDAIDHADPSNW